LDLAVIHSGVPGTITVDDIITDNIIILA